MEHPEEFESMTFNERFSLIVDRESDVRLNTKLKKLITSAKFPSNTADMEDILYWPDRHLDRDLIQMLRTNAYIDKKRNVMFLGPTGSGKTFLANALGINACRDGYKVLYLRLNIPGLMSPPVRKTETVIPDKKKLQIPDFGNRLDL
jgi:DNA replication protein DnaC